MKILEGFEDPDLVRALAAQVAEKAARRDHYTFMEVCGTHTQALGRWALRSLLPEHVRLVSGPGCPVCVTPGEYIDNACALALEKNVTIATYGDLVRVPGQKTSLEQAQGQGAEVEVVYSVFDALKLAGETDKEIVFLGIGFETTIAGIAAAIETAQARQVENFSVYTSFRLVPPALAALVADPEIKLDGFLLPGHASVIIGLDAYKPLLDVPIAGMIAGFEPVDILRGTLGLVEAVNGDGPLLQNLYPRAVRDRGNEKVQALFQKLFEPAHAVWRGIGLIPDSGYTLRPAYEMFDAESRYGLGALSPDMAGGCQCGQVLKGLILPDQCPLFGSSCTPHNPVGPCMVSGEGSCAAYYKYRG